MRSRWCNRDLGQLAGSYTLASRQRNLQPTRLEGHTPSMKRHMLKAWFCMACLFLSILGNAVRGLGQDVGAKTGGHASGTSALKCKVWARNVKSSDAAQVIRKGKPATIHVELTNQTPNPIYLTQMTVYLSRATGSRLLPGIFDPEYYAPVDVEKKSAPGLTAFREGEMFPRGHLPIAAGQSIEFEIDVTSLRWAKMIWSGLSLVTFFGVVEDGRFDEYLSLRTEEAGLPSGLESNRLPVEIRR